MNDRNGTLAAPLLTDTKIDLELKLENEMAVMGCDRYQRRRISAEDRGAHLTLPPNLRLARQWFDDYAGAIAQAKDAFTNGWPENDIAVWGPVFDQLDAARIAKAALETAYSILITNPTGISTTSLVYRMGEAVLAEIYADRMQSQGRSADREYEKRIDRERASGSDPDIQRQESERNFWNYLSHRYKSLSPKVIRRIQREQDHIQASRQISIGCGFKLLELLECSATLPIAGEDGDEPQFKCAIWTKVRKQGSHGRMLTQRFTKMDDEAIALVEKWHERRSLLRPRYMPSVVSPYPWGIAKPDDNRADLGLVRGGYVNLKGPLVSNITKDQRAAITDAARSGKLSPFLECFNALQEGANWRVNTRMLGVQKELYERGSALLELPHSSNLPFPQRPQNWDDVEAVRAYQEERRRVKRDNAHRVSERQYYLSKIETAEKYAALGDFYNPFMLCFRGRAYPRPVGLNYYESDVTRGLLMYGTPVSLSSVGYNNLKIRAANCFGKDKLSFDERCKWADANMDMMLRCAIDPTGEDWWHQAEEPWQFLATCMGFHDPENIGSRLPLWRDGTANAMQWYGALLRDDTIAPLVNLVPTEVPGDSYSVGVEGVRREIEAESQTSDVARTALRLLNRKIAKTPQMTTWYGVTIRGAKLQTYPTVEAALCPDGKPDKETRALCHKVSQYLANTIMRVVKEAYPKPCALMRWFSTAAKECAKRNVPYSFDTPLGWPVVQPYRQDEMFYIATIAGSVKLRSESTGVELKSRKQATAAPPTTIHAFDGTHMLKNALACRRAGIFYSPVHDAHGTHCETGTVLDEIVRDEWIKLHSGDLLGWFKDHLEAKHRLGLPDVPEYGTLDVESVRDSKYFAH